MLESQNIMKKIKMYNDNIIIISQVNSYTNLRLENNSGFLQNRIKRTKYVRIIWREAIVDFCAKKLLI